MNGIRLSELDASDMLDVIHYFFEEDSHYSSEVQADTKGVLRDSLYRQLYGKPYKGYIPKKESVRDRNFDMEDDLTPFDPTRSNEVKPYFPPTDISENSSNPFGGVLDAPIN